jgi:hypothetical protein
MEDCPQQSARADWLRHFLDISREYLGLATTTLSVEEKPPVAIAELN